MIFYFILPNSCSILLQWEINDNLLYKKHMHPYCTLALLFFKHWMYFVCHMTMQQHFMDKKKNTTRQYNSTLLTFLSISQQQNWSQQQEKTTQILIHFLGNNSLRGGRVGKLNHLIELILTSWLVPRSPIQCERTSFPASFASSASRKNYMYISRNKWFKLYMFLKGVLCYIHCTC